jgi:hypothetical protein
VQVVTVQSISELKKNNATYKVLAAVWVLAQNYQLGNQLDLSLACFLPPGEYRDRENFQTQLETALKEFETPTGIFKVNLIDFNCKPEGAGVFMHHRRKVGSSALSKTVEA